MTIRATNNTPAARAADRPRPARALSQAQLRERRRVGLIHRYGSGWSLTTEVGHVCAPLAARITEVPNPARYWRSIDDVTLAMHGLVHAVVGLLAERDAQRRTRGLGADDRARSIRALVDLAERPKLPEVTDDMICDGTWAAQLVVLADPYSAELADLLGRALTSVVSDRLLAALTDVDRAVLALARRLDNDQEARAARRAQAATDTDPRCAELAALGITT